MEKYANLRSQGLFDAKVPRFTSYPPANYFTDEIDAGCAEQWFAAVPDGARISLYLHVPFCRRLCWFCACRTQGTSSLTPLDNYVAALGREIETVRKHLPQRVSVARLHFGGGTPTLLPVPLMRQVLSTLTEAFGLDALTEFSVEIDPTEVDAARLELLKEFGLSRASLGVQDFEPAVQKAIGREQSREITQETVDILRDLGVNDINFDLLYGLPFQTRRSIRRTLDAVLEMSPSRLALYGYAHVPWASKRQQLIPEDALPNPEARYELFEDAQRTLLGAGMRQVGIDHFAHPSDSLAIAMDENRLARSFQGYTDDRMPWLIGLGASSISRFPQGYLQNQPRTADYHSAVNTGQLSVARGYRLNPREKQLAAIIESLMCYHRVDAFQLGMGIEEVKAFLAPLQAEFPDAMTLEHGVLVVKRWAWPLLRIFAARLAETSPQEGLYSAAV